MTLKRLSKNASETRTRMRILKVVSRLFLRSNSILSATALDVYAAMKMPGGMSHQVRWLLAKGQPGATGASVVRQRRRLC